MSKLGRRGEWSRRESLARLGLGFAVGATGAFGGDGQTQNGALRVSVSEDAIKGVNRNDAAAAIALWAEELAKAAQMTLVPDQKWVRTRLEMVAAVRAGEVDAVSVTVAEYPGVAPYLDVTRVLLDMGTEMCLVVSERAGIRSVSDLTGKQLLLVDGPHTLLSDAWLTVLLARDGLGLPERVLGRIRRHTKATQAVLPVFFGQADACIVSRATIETMAELNPQVGKQMRVLARAPKLASAFLACRKQYPAERRNNLLEKA
ncbi:MAG: PhnD/SsuA/transferrin family substrate-binding protein, partial [Bryobacterales bacterium]|nr:PhnD/SsuA/transferrin family substrate-binding protein [Bryobacterales bacterium]